MQKVLHDNLLPHFERFYIKKKVTIFYSGLIRFYFKKYLINGDYFDRMLFEYKIDEFNLI